MANTDSTTLPAPIPTSPNVTALAKHLGVDRRTIQRRLKNGWVPPATTAATPAAPAVTILEPMPHSMPHMPQGCRTVTVAAFVVAVALAAVSGFFGIVGMTAIFAAAALPVMVMTGVLEAAKLVTAAWLTRHWHVAPWLLRLPLVCMVLLMMALTACGTFGFLSRAHLEQQVTATAAIDHDAAPLDQRIELAQSTVHDLDGRIIQLDDMVKAATARAYTRTAMLLVGTQASQRAVLVSERDKAAAVLADLKIAQAGILARRATVAAEVGPALYLAKLFGSDDSEAAVRLITALLVLVLDPLAVLLTIAASRRP